jgi:hypothetical protein
MRMKAPSGSTSFSIEGISYDVDEDGTVDVTEHVAAVLRSHGFVEDGGLAVRPETEPVEPSPAREVSEETGLHVRVLRTDMVEMLETLGILVPDDMDEEKLVTLLKDAIRASRVRAGKQPRKPKAAKGEESKNDDSKNGDDEETKEDEEKVDY